MNQINIKLDVLSDVELIDTRKILKRGKDVILNFQLMKENQHITNKGLVLELVIGEDVISYTNTRDSVQFLIEGENINEEGIYEYELSVSNSLNKTNKIYIIRFLVKNISRDITNDEDYFNFIDLNNIFITSTEPEILDENSLFFIKEEEGE